VHNTDIHTSSEISYELECTMPVNPADVRNMAERYTAAWCSHVPESVASFYTEQGRITINHGQPATGRDEIAEVAKRFFAQFPDLVVGMDDVRCSANNAIYVWTLEGTNDGPGGSGHRVRIAGWENWRLSDDVLVEESFGFFDADEYARQLAHGVP